MLNAFLVTKSANLNQKGMYYKKELGVVVSHCVSLAEDAAKIFDSYWLLASQKTLPTEWPQDLETSYDLENPLVIQNSYDDTELAAWLGSSPALLGPESRPNDLQILINAIQGANRFIHIALGDYMPVKLFGPSRGEAWPVIDSLLKDGNLLIKQLSHQRYNNV